MNQELRIRELARLFREAGAAHHQAFLDTNGDDPDWPHWYALYLGPKLRALFGLSVSLEELARLLMALEAERMRQKPAADWPTFYADYLLSREYETAT